MKRWGKWGILALTVVGAVAVAGRVVISQQPAAPPVANPYAELFDKARPHLEAVLRDRFDGLQFSTATAAQLPRVPDADLDAHLRWHFPHLQGTTLAKTREVARQVVATATVAQYAEGHNVIVVVPDNFEKIAAWDPELARVNSAEFVQLALVYEAVRAHLDQRFNLAKLRADCCDAEDFAALQALVDGRAYEVCRRVAERLGTQALVPLLAQRWLRVPDEVADPSLKAASQTYLHGRAAAATRGAAFHNALWDAALKDVEGEIFTARPRQLSAVARPARWLGSRFKQQPSLAEVLRPLEGTFPGADWQPMQQSWTPAMLGQVAAMLGAPKERVEKAAASWYEGRTLVWLQRGRPDRQVALSVVRHDGEAGARSYLGFAVDLQRKQDTLPPGTCGPTIQVVESKMTSLRLEGFDEAVRNDKRIRLGAGEPVPVSVLLARSGELVVECTWHGGTADAATAERLVQAVRAGAR
jgi:hypothetical protein